MKRILGIIIAVLMAILFWVGLTLVFYSGGLGLVISILIPPGCAIAAILLIVLVDIVIDLIEG